LHNPVYPRWRGEHFATLFGKTEKAGLSPLARGTPLNPGGVTRTQRFIPAGAGNTTADEMTHRDVTVYPRWRGEHWGLIRVIAVGYGLSPLARGTQ